MRRVELTIAFIDDDGSRREKRHSLETFYTPDSAAEHSLVHILATELKARFSEESEPKHNDIARGWLNFPAHKADIAQIFNIENPRAMWLELANLVLDAEGGLAQAQAYKALEPSEVPSLADDLAIKNLYYIHDRKMTLLNQSVQHLYKVQDLVNRLIHESLEGDLVDTSKLEWEKNKLTRENIETQLKSRCASGAISETDFAAISHALAIPDSTPQADIVKVYRNRLMHHTRPSVDYAMFFSTLQAREGKKLEDAQGKVIGSQHSLFASQPIEYKFLTVSSACSEHLVAIVAMLEELSRIGLLRR